MAHLLEPGLQGFTFDRRCRGDSSDTAPYAPEREAEDLRAVIDAVDDPAAILGQSSVRSSRCWRRPRAYRSRTCSCPSSPLRFGHCRCRDCRRVPLRQRSRGSGDPDYVVHVATPDIVAYEILREEKLATLPGVRRLTSTIVMNRVVDDPTCPVLPDR